MKNLNNFVTHSLGLRLVCGNCFQKCRISNKEAVKLKISTRLATVSMTVDSKSKKSCQKIRENRQKFNGSNGCSLVLFSSQVVTHNQNSSLSQPLDRLRFKNELDRLSHRNAQRLDE